MRRGQRFGLWVALAAMGAGLASFVVALQVLDDGKPDVPPGATDQQAADTTSTTSTASAPSSTTSSSTTAVPGRLRTPTWVAIVASERSRSEAESAAAEAAAAGLPAGVLQSDDYESLSKGLWVGYAGPYDRAKDAEDAVSALKDAGIDGAYVRCVGSKDDCEDKDD